MSQLRRGFKTWCENAAASYRRDLGLERTGPLNPQILARHLKIVVWKPEQIPGMTKEVLAHLTVADPESWDAVTIHAYGVTAVILNSAPDIGRQNNSLSHELSHIILEHEPTRVFHTQDGHLMINEYNTVHEEEADCLAGALLLPREALLQSMRTGGLTEAAMARHFGVSVALLRMRRNITGVDRQLAHSRG